MPSLRQKIFTAVIMITVIFAQVAGMQRGYLCGHSGKVVETSAKHCHEEFADTSEDHIPCEKECDGSKPQEQHAPVVVELKARSSAATVDAPEFVAVQLLDLMGEEWTLATSVLEAAVSDRFVLLTEGQKPPPTAVQVARSVVLLV